MSLSTILSNSLAVLGLQLTSDLPEKRGCSGLWSDMMLILLVNVTDSPRPITLDALGHRGLLVVYVLYVLHLYPALPSGPPCSEQQGHRLQAHHKIRCL